MIAHNFLWLSGARMAELAVGLFAGIYARRVLGVTAIGQYSWCLAVIGYFSLLANPHISMIALRDVAREPQLAARRLSQIVPLEFSLALIAFGLVCVLASTNVRGPEIGQLLILSAIALLFIPFDLSWLMRAHERMAPAAIAQLSVQIIRLPALLLFVREPAHVTRYTWLAYPFQVVSLFYLWWYAGRHRLIRWADVRPSFRGAWRLLKDAFPLGLSQAATALYGNFDAILLGFLSSDSVVGIYSTAYNLMMIPTFLSAALTHAYFPHLSRVHNNEQQSVIFSSDFLRIHVWMGMSIAALGWAFGRHVVVLLYGSAFADGGPLLEWLSLDLALIFFSTAIGQPLNAWGLQRPYFVSTLAGAVVNVVLNCLFIPWFGVWGAVVTTLLAEGVVSVGCLWIRRTHVPISWCSITARPLLVCLTAAVIGRHLASAYPRQWPISTILVAGGICAAFWICERRGLPGLLRRVHSTPETADP